jgi:hypothetical protein
MHETCRIDRCTVLVRVAAVAFAARVDEKTLLRAHEWGRAEEIYLMQEAARQQSM